MQDAFRRIFKSFPWRTPACIAGGSVVDFDKAADIDVFVLDSLDKEDGIDFDRVQDVVDALDLCAGKQETPTELEARGYYGDRCLFMSGYHPGIVKRIEVIATSYQSVEALIDSFDLSTHAWALKNPHHIVGSMLNSTSRWESPRVMRWTTPDATLARMLKLVDRYKLPIHKADYIRLKTLIAKEKHAKTK